jgi:AcrR family transcriptional regulator
VRETSDTAARLVAAAESLFVEGGEAATSLRAVARVAHANAAAVHYHFGGRDELLRAVFERHLAPVGQRRLRLLDEAPATVEGLLEAIVRPDLELLGKLRRHKVEVARFLGRTAANPAIDALVRRDAEALAVRALPLLVRALPELAPAELAARLSLVRATVVALFAEAGPAPPLGLDNVDDQVRRLVAFCAGGLRAPAPSGPRPRGRKRRKGP